ncbi:hypothetical protein [Anabaena sp. CCY 0017]|uniref:hypothetical protein n=1 Tax=Anabaena sp. CCY 0017 TaxID=3103866 RepID=UPI0039C6A26F
MSNCPMGLIDACVSVSDRVNRCQNFYKCDRVANTTVMLPYNYNHERKCLTVNGTHPQVLRHYYYQPDNFSIENWHHDLSYLAQEEIEALGFARAVDNPSFDREIWLKYQPIEEDDPDDDGIPF